MAKKRNSRKLRPQEYPDAQDFQYGREDRDMPDDEEPARPIKPVLDWKAECIFSEGQLVTISESQINGTVVSCVGKDIMVLDASGIIHCLKDHAVYFVQSLS